MSWQCFIFNFVFLAFHLFGQGRAAHSQREKQRLLAMLFSTSKCEKSKAKLKLAEAKVET